MKKTIATLAVLSMVFVGLMPSLAQAQTNTELQAQINSLLNLISQLQARLASGTATSTSPSQSFVFTGDLTVGSRGESVNQLQMFLVSKGFLVMPQGVAFGYFGNLTQSSLGRFQASQGISPTAGFFGPITRTKINSLLATETPPTTTPPTSGGTGITTPGIEGTMSVTSSNVGLRSTVYENDREAPVLGMKISARQSDIAVQRVKINLGNSSRVYNRLLSKLYVTDGSAILASSDLNSSTVTREGNEYFITITGFNYLIPKNTEKNLVIKADVYSSIDSTDRNTPLTIQLANSGIRGIDGAGIDHYSPSTGSTIARSVNVSQSLAETSTLRLSLNSGTPRTQEVVADAGVNNNELDKLTLLTFDIKSERDNVTITDLQVNVSKSGSGTATASSTIYLYDGSTEIDNASVVNGVATFQNLDYTIPQDSTKTLSVRTDIRNANANSATFIASIPSSGIIAENRLGDQLSSGDVSGSAVGYAIGVRNVGSGITLVSKSVTTSGVPQGNDETSAMTATFNVRVRAVGSDLVLGTPASTTPAFGADSFVIYRNGIVTTVGADAKSFSFSTPSGANTSGLTNSFRIPEGTEVTIPVTFQVRGRVSGSALTSGLYSIGLEQINWIAGDTAQTINFMAGDPDWRTNDVSFP